MLFPSKASTTGKVTAKTNSYIWIEKNIFFNHWKIWKLNLFNLKEITSFHLLHLKFKKLSVVKCKYRKIVISTNHFHQRPTSLTIIEDEDQDEVEAQNLETKKKSIGIVLLKHSRLEIRANFAWNNARLNNEVITFSWISNFIPFGSYQ